MNYQLKTGKTISISIYDFYFRLKDEEVEEFHNNCVADDLGIEINNPFSSRGFTSVIQEEDPPPEEELEDLPE